MDQFIEYFSSMPTSHRTIILVAGLTLFWSIEAISPLFKRDYGVGKHALSNLFFTLTTAIVNMPLAFILVKASDMVVVEDFGILQWSGIGVVGSLLIGLLLMDLISAWFIHYLEHKVTWMWKFHAVHHADQNVDTTSGNRHHPGESVFRFVFTLLASIIVGAPMWLIFVYQSVSVVMTQFNHANTQLPEWLDKSISWLIVTPNMHHVHHHYRLPYSDMNYGNIFSIWDRLFNTFVKVDNDKLVYGLDTHMDQKHSTNIWSMLKMPFEKYKGHIAYKEDEQL